MYKNFSSATELQNYATVCRLSRIISRHCLLFLKSVDLLKFAHQLSLYCLELLGGDISTTIRSTLTFGRYCFCCPPKMWLHVR